MGAGWMNLASIILGLLSWILPCAVIVRQGNITFENGALALLLSAGACVISLCLQLQYSAYLVEINDISAILDTGEAVALVANILVVITFVLDGLAFLLLSKTQRGKRQ